MRFVLSLFSLFGVLIKLNIEEHANCRHLVAKLLKQKGEENYMEHASTFACSAGVPIFTTYFFIGEIIGFNPELVERMRYYAKFYAYTKIQANTDIDLEQFIGEK